MTSSRSRPSAPKTKEQIQQAFGRRLKSLRQAQGWSMERGITFASLDTLSRIASALKTNISALFEFDDSSSSSRVIEALLKNQPPEVIEAAEHQVKALVDLATRLRRQNI